MDDSLIADIRAFNRFYTRQIGLLDEHIVDSPFSLAEARVIYEIAARGHTTATELGRSLGLDRAYLSRILQGFLGKELIVLSPIPGDRRQNQIALTRDGDAVAAGLNAGSDLATAKLVAPLLPAQRDTLRAAMQSIRGLLGDDMPAAPVLLRPHRLGELGWLIYRQAVLYNQQLGWNGEFETLIAKIYHDYEEAPARPPKGLWVAERRGAVVGSVFATPHAGKPDTAQLRMLYVEPEMRGLGIGTMLVAQCVDFARQNGYARVRLWTQSILKSARKIYAAAGFTLVESNPHHSFGHDLVGEYWELVL